MITEQEILAFALSLREKQGLRFSVGAQYGAKWANDQNSIEIAAKDAEIAELVKAVKSLKAAYEVLMRDVKAVNRHFKPLPQEKAALSRADELIKKYGK